MRVFGHAFFACLFIGIPLGTHAEVFCAYKVEHVWVTPDGWVNATFSSGLGNKNWWLCQQGANTPVNDGYADKMVNANTCAAVFSQLLSARLSDHVIFFQFHGPNDCNAANLPADGRPTLYPANIGFQ